MERMNPASAEMLFITQLRNLLTHRHWEVQDQPILGTARPDLLIRDPAGHVFVADIKFGEGASHFGSVAQAASYATIASSFLNSSVTAWLITDQKLPSGVSEAAEKLGVEVVEGSVVPESESGHKVERLASAFVRDLLGEEEGVGSSSS
jgi:hypothetical protein